VNPLTLQFLFQTLTFLSLSISFIIQAFELRIGARGTNRVLSFFSILVATLFAAAWVVTAWLVPAGAEPTAVSDALRWVALGATAVVGLSVIALVRQRTVRSRGE
jgi:hypothetical protein